MRRAAGVGPGVALPGLTAAAGRIQPRTVLAYSLTNGKQPATIQPFPAGLKMVAGPGPGVAQWACRRGDRDSAASMTGAPDCKKGEVLVVRIFFPDCWDGT